MNGLVEVAGYIALGIVVVLFIGLLQAVLWGAVVEAGIAIRRYLQRRKADESGWADRQELREFELRRAREEQRGRDEYHL